MSEKFKITPPGVPNNGIMFVNHQPENRSGHMGHALVEYAPGKILAFYPNCSSEDQKFKGHSGHGWMEYKRSEDGGITWSEPVAEPNSKALFDKNIGRTFMCEKAVITDTGRIVLFYLTCDIVTGGHIWEPYFEPYYAVSEDDGATFSEPKQLFDECGRVYDAIYRNGVIYVLFLNDPELPGKAHSGDYSYKLYASYDNGETFKLQSVIPFEDTVGCLYGTMCFSDESKLMVYVYSDCDEHYLKLITSDDNGITWNPEQKVFFDKKIRNPQVILCNDTYFLHGRGGIPEENYGALVLYLSPDGVNWEDGIYLRHKEKDAGCGAYSNNLVVHLPDNKKRIMIQSSHAYKDHRTNTIMFFIDFD